MHMDRYPFLDFPISYDYLSHEMSSQHGWFKPLLKVPELAATSPVGSIHVSVIAMRSPTWGFFSWGKRG